MKPIAKPIDMSKVRAVIYHLHGGDKLVLKMDSIQQFVDFGAGKICDTSDIDGTIHFFPLGNC
ncbi:hypothetical protein ACFL6N_01775 [Thermodesulfobacteriota bacterium]